jgi:hypothetical protein
MDKLPTCPMCARHPLLPLSDYGEGGGSVQWKAWACSDKKCGYAIRIDKGKISYETVR